MRSDVSKMQAALSSDYCFILDEHFPWKDFLTNKPYVHAYLGYDGLISDPIDPSKMRLVLLTADTDKNLDSLVTEDLNSLSETNKIHIAPYEIQQNIPNVVAANEKVSLWRSEGDQWIEDVTGLNPNLEDIEVGITRVFAVPLFDLIKQIYSDNAPSDYLAMNIYMGLRSHGALQARSDLITYHPATQSLISFSSTDEFTSPKPPFGSQSAFDNFGLLN